MDRTYTGGIDRAHDGGPYSRMTAIFPALENVTAPEEGFVLLVNSTRIRRPHERAHDKCDTWAGG